jgi:hypothetical protein
VPFRKRQPIPTTELVEHVELVPEPVELPELDRRARAFDRVAPLLTTTVPTRHIVDSYLDDVLQP